MEIRVTSTAGRAATFNLPTNSTAADLKVAIAVEWNVPGILQSLLVGEVQLQDEEVLHARDQHCSVALDITLIVTFEALPGQNASKANKMAALQELSRYRGSEPALDAVRVYLKDGHRDVQKAALKALCHLWVLGNETIIPEFVSQVREIEGIGFFNLTCYSAAELKLAGFSLETLRDWGFTSVQALSVGFSLRHIQRVNLTALLWALDCTVSHLIYHGFTLLQLKQGGYSCRELKDCGFQAAQLFEQGGFTVQQLREAGFSSADFKESGFTALQLANDGFTAAQLKDAQYEAFELKPAGFSAHELWRAGYSVREIRQAAITRTLADIATAAELREAGVSLQELQAAGFTPLPFSATELHRAGFEAMDLTQVKTSSVELHALGFTAAALKEAGWTAWDLQRAGFSAAQVCEAGFSARKVGRTSGFSVGQLRGAALRCDELSRYGFTNAEILAGGFTHRELRDHGFTAKQLKTNGFPPDRVKAEHLKDAGFTCSELREARYTQKELVDAGFAATDLLNEANFSPEKLADYGVGFGPPE